MLLLSCAKTMSRKSEIKPPFATEPTYAKEASYIIGRLLQYDAEELKKILKIPDRIAAENLLRYQDFHSTTTTSLQALLAYTGIVFKNISPEDFSQEDFEYAQNHLRITSFCYGLLRPMDLIKPYRLEGDVDLSESGTENMYAYWNKRLTEGFISEIKKTGGILFNLASNEMKYLFDWKRIESECHIITPQFKLIKNGKMKTIVIYTKMARGAMTRFILKNRIENPEILKTFTWEGFHFDPTLSDDKNYIFTLE